MNQFFDKNPPNENFPICNKCKHQLKNLKCKAFNKIPNEILLGENNHTKPLPTQKNNIVFEAL
tara:strand:+ start:731 stop:919 length:189 start_codon:yes stop_codon:yes gene_type:complete